MSTLTPAEVIAFPAVKARNGLKLLDAAGLREATILEAAGKRRAIILEAIASRLRKLGDKASADDIEAHLKEKEGVKAGDLVVLADPSQPAVALADGQVLAKVKKARAARVPKEKKVRVAKEKVAKPPRVKKEKPVRVPRVVVAPGELVPPKLPHTCTRCKVTVAATVEEVAALFGLRTMKPGGPRRIQPQCKKCRGMKPIQPRAPKAEPAAADPASA